MVFATLGFVLLSVVTPSPSVMCSEVAQQMVEAVEEGLLTPEQANRITNGCYETQLGSK